MIRISVARHPEDFDAVRALCWEYRAFLLTLDASLAALIRLFYSEDGYRRLLDGLAETHVRPEGAVMLARKDGRPVGCGMSHRLLPGAAEIKRVYVRPEARGLGAGRAIMLALIEQCREDGFERILMDTGIANTEAQRLYDRLGFHLRGPYQPMPSEAEGLMVFYEMPLVPQEAAPHP